MQFKKPMANKSPEFISHNSKPGDEVHCVAIVVDASHAREDDDTNKRQLFAFMDILNEKGKPQNVIFLIILMHRSL